MRVESNKQSCPKRINMICYAAVTPLSGSGLFLIYTERLYMFKAIGLVLLSVIVIAAITVFSGFFDLEYTKFFSPRKENVKRQVFENTQSYTHGKIQDLAKYYDEYRKCEDIGEKSAIESMIKMQFSDFNASTINNIQLRNFLLSTRGY